MRWRCTTVSWFRIASGRKWRSATGTIKPLEHGSSEEVCAVSRVGVRGSSKSSQHRGAVAFSARLYDVFDEPGTTGSGSEPLGIAGRGVVQDVLADRVENVVGIVRVAVKDSGTI